MAYSYSKTHAKGEEDFYKAGQIFQDLGYALSDVYKGAKYGIIKLSFEIPDDCKNDFDSGIVKGENFVIKKIDRYGDNPMYYYSDDKGLIFVQDRFAINSSVKFENKSLYGGELMSNPEAIEYIKNTKRVLKELRENALKEYQEKENDEKKL